MCLIRRTIFPFWNTHTFCNSKIIFFFCSFFSFFYLPCSNIFSSFLSFLSLFFAFFCWICLQFLMSNMSFMLCRQTKKIFFPILVYYSSFDHNKTWLYFISIYFSVIEFILLIKRVLLPSLDLGFSWRVIMSANIYEARQSDLKIL